MNTLNPIQILDMQELIVQNLEALYKKLSSSSYRGAKQLVIADIKRFEDAQKKLEIMYIDAIKQEG
jgi:predicted transcriptional regulator